MESGWKLSRRALLQSLSGVLGPALLGPDLFNVWRAAAATVQAGGGRHPGYTQQVLEGYRRSAMYSRRYRVDATILVCDIPIFSRKGVGGGYAAVEVAGAAGEPSAMGLQFGAGSFPGRAGGVNRFGVIREAVTARAGGDQDFSFAGLITSTKEDDIGEARKALHSGARTAKVTLARGHASEGQIRSWTESLEVPATDTWAEAVPLLENMVRTEPNGTVREVAAKAVMPFLATMRAVALSSRNTYQFVHNAKLYSLEIQRHGGAGASVAGQIRNSAGQKASEFRVFYEPGDESGIPTRIDYRPKSFLRLLFEPESAGTQPAIPSLFNEEVS